MRVCSVQVSQHHGEVRRRRHQRLLHGNTLSFSLLQPLLKLPARYRAGYSMRTRSHVTRHTSHVTRSRAHSPAFPLRLRPQVLQPRFCNIHQLLGRLLLPRDEPGCSVMLQKYTGTAALRASARAGSPSNLLVLVNHVANSRAPVLQCRSFSIQRAVLPAHLVDFPP